LTADMATAEYQSLLEIWLRMLRYAELSTTEIEKFRTSYGRDVALLSPEKVASIMTEGGFDRPVLFYQSLLVRAWYAQRRPE
jgi:tRNA (cmo5U34)-methyltransferase